MLQYEDLYEEQKIAMNKMEQDVGQIEDKFQEMNANLVETKKNLFVEKERNQMLTQEVDFMKENKGIKGETIVRQLKTLEDEDKKEVEQKLTEIIKEYKPKTTETKGRYYSEEEEQAFQSFEYILRKNMQTLSKTTEELKRALVGEESSVEEIANNFLSLMNL